MRDGSYRIRLAADGYAGRGTLQLERNRGRGHDGSFSVAIHVVSDAPTLTAVVDIDLTADAVGNTRMPDRYALDMTGHSVDADTFALIGVGPLGLIIELQGVREA